MPGQNREDGGESLAALARAQSMGKKPAAPVRRRVSPMMKREAPRWYRTVAPVLFILGGILMIIGLWAVGAMVYMNKVTPESPEEINYPLLHWSDEEGSVGGYSAESRMMAMTMLACVPLSLVMGGIVMVLRNQIRRRQSGE